MLIVKSLFAKNQTYLKYKIIVNPPPKKKKFGVNFLNNFFP